jgi:hypothetical protein
MADLFKDIIPSLLLTKKYCLEDEKDYNAYVVNKVVSNHQDGIFLAVEMNKYPDLPKKAQYDFYFNGLVSKRRPYVKWNKNAKEADVELVKKYFNYNETKARDALKILNTNQLDMIRKILEASEEHG